MGDRPASVFDHSNTPTLQWIFEDEDDDEHENERERRFMGKARRSLQLRAVGLEFHRGDEVAEDSQARFGQPVGGGKLEFARQFLQVLS